MKIRIQKLLSDSGVASRRHVEEMILDGRITVNGTLVADLPCFVDPDRDDIRLDSQPVRKRPARYAYILLNKPRGVVCTHEDPAGRPRAVDLAPAKGLRLYTVGRLDVESTGLVLLTNDGELTQYLTHPRYGVTKTDLAEVAGHLSEQEMARLKGGTYLEGRRTRPLRVKVVRRHREGCLLEIRVCEGPNRQLRRILAALGHKVLRLKRVAIGPITDRGLKIGHFRFLKPAEVAKLRRCGRVPAGEESPRR